MYPLTQNGDGAVMARGSERIFQVMKVHWGPGAAGQGRPTGRPDDPRTQTKTHKPRETKREGGFKGGGWPHHRHTTRRGEEDTRQKTNDAQTSNPVGATNKGDARKTGGVVVVQQTGRSITGSPLIGGDQHIRRVHNKVYE